MIEKGPLAGSSKKRSAPSSLVSDSENSINRKIRNKGIGSKWLYLSGEEKKEWLRKWNGKAKN